MNSRFHRLTAFALLITASAGLRGETDLIYSVIGPSAAAAAGATIEVQVAVLNRSTRDVVVDLPATVDGSLVTGGTRSVVTLQLRASEPAPAQTIPTSGFALRTYAVVLPADTAIGLAALEIKFPDTITTRTALEITSSGAVASGGNRAATHRPTSDLLRTAPAIAAWRRVLADRLAAHEQVYFIYGPDDPAAKFQFSFKYKLLDFRDVAEQRMARSLHFAFTQRSLWDLNGDSSPFYDTSYMPELLYQSLAPAPEERGGLVTWLGFQAAFKHESNGRDGPLSRSLNAVYARTAFAFGRLDDWHLLVMPEVFGYVSPLDENTAIKDYRGYGKLRLVLGRNDGASLTATLWAGKDFDHGSAQLDLTLPVRTGLLSFESFFLVQYFNGYGESLLSYRTHSETIRAGMSLVR